MACGINARKPFACVKGFNYFCTIIQYHLSIIMLDETFVGPIFVRVLHFIWRPHDGYRHEVWRYRCNLIGMLFAMRYLNP